MSHRASQLSLAWLPRCLFLVALLLCPTHARADSASAPLPASRFGYSRTMVHGVNEQDFRSAMQVYSRVIAQLSNISTATDLRIFESTAEMTAALRADQINMVAAPTEEIFAVPAELLDPQFIVSAHSGTGGLEYLLLVHNDNPARNLADLHGQSLNIVDSSQYFLASHWLETLLDHEQLPRPAQHFRRLRPCAKPSLAILPVFFRQADACLVTAQSFATLCELNPQLGRQLRTIVRSPRLFPILTAFRRGMDPQLRSDITQAMFKIKDTAAGRQLLTLFQTDSLTYCTIEDLAATRALLATHAEFIRRDLQAGQKHEH